MSIEWQHVPAAVLPNQGRQTPRLLGVGAIGADGALNPVERSFLYMPYMHSESLKIHEVAVGLFRSNGLSGNLDFELKHKAIIERFGRYPHRNAILGRVSTEEEIEFLQQPGSSF